MLKAIAQRFDPPVIPLVKPRRLGMIITAIVGLACAGCSSEAKLETFQTVVEVAYKNGKPVRGAIVTFRSAVDRSITAKGRADLDGICKLTTYELGDGSVLGDHQAIVVGGVGDGNMDLDDTQLPTVARMFSSFATSNLRFTVTENDADNHFKITVAP